MSGNEVKTLEDDAEYQRKYYQENREKLLREKASRYRSDPEYRKAAIARSKETKKKARLERQALIRKEGPKPRMIKPKPFDIKMGRATVETVMMVSGQLGQRLGRKTQTIRIWEKKGILPEAMYRDPKTGARLYTEDQVRALTIAYQEAEKKFGEKFTKNRISLTSFPAAAKEIWEQWPTGIAVS